MTSTLAAAVLLGSFCAAAEQAAVSETAAQPAKGAAEAPADTDVGLSLALDGGLLTARIDNRPLLEVVVALAEHIPLKVYLRQSVREEIAERRVFARFNELPLQDALAEIFQGQNYLLKYSSTPAKDEDAPPERVIEVWLAGGAGQYAALADKPATAAVEPPSVLSRLEASNEAGREDLSEAADHELRELALNASNPRTRLNALLYLGDRIETPEIVDTFVDGLDDRSTEVREMALGQILTTRQDVPSDVYRKVINSDPDPGMRKQALAILVHKKGREATGVLTEVLTGDDPNMSAYAQQLLDYLDRQPE